MNTAQGSVVVKAPIDSVYRRWLRVEDYPKFMTAVKEVRKLDENHFSIGAVYRGQRHEGVLEIMLRVPDRRLAWRIVSNQFAAGVVSFATRPNQSTCVTLKMSSSFDGALSRRLGRYLRNFKRFVERPLKSTTNA